MRNIIFLALFAFVLNCVVVAQECGPDGNVAANCDTPAVASGCDTPTKAGCGPNGDLDAFPTFNPVNFLDRSVPVNLGTGNFSASNPTDANFQAVMGDYYSESDICEVQAANCAPNASVNAENCAPTASVNAENCAPNASVNAENCAPTANVNAENCDPTTSSVASNAANCVDDPTCLTGAEFVIGC